MRSQSNSNDLVSMLLKKIQGGSHADYTLVSSNQPSPLYDMAKKYRKKYPKRPVHSEFLISEITDPISQNSMSSPKLWIEARVVIRLMPDIVLARLLNDPVIIKYNDGTGSFYDPLSIIISIKGAQDFIHEIGHHIWNTWLIRDDEDEKRIAVNQSYVNGAEFRKRLPDDLIPDSHKEYAGLIGAWSGQFIEAPSQIKISKRRNDLEEHFARNFDYLLRGRVLDVSRHSRARLGNLLHFFIKYGLSDKKHSSLYRHLLKEIYGKESLNYIDPNEAEDGISMTRDELFNYHKNRIVFETGKDISITSQISLALDLKEDFIEFCIKKNVLEEIRGALKQKGITLLDFQRFP